MLLLMSVRLSTIRDWCQQSCCCLVYSALYESVLNEQFDNFDAYWLWLSLQICHQKNHAAGVQVGDFRTGLVSSGSVGLVFADVLVGFAASTWRTTCGRTTHLKPPLTATWCPSAVSSTRSFGKMFPRGRFVLNCWLMHRLHVKHWLQMHC